jgi:hypothetical protein
VCLDLFKILCHKSVTMIKIREELLVSAEVELAVVNSEGEISKLSANFLDKLI